MSRSPGDLGEDHGADTGCRYAPSCLDCPFPVCKEDDPGWFIRNAKAIRREKMLTTIKAEGLSGIQAADRFGVSVRHIYRLKLRGKSA